MQLGDRRFSVIGASGSGKTCVAREIASTLGIPHVELDALFWNPGWAESPTDVFRERVAAALCGTAWVADGNYRTVRDIVWDRAETVAWLDYPLPRVMWNLLRRTVRRSLTGEELWSGNRESLRSAFLSRNSIILYTLRTFRARRRSVREMLQWPEYAHLRLVRLRSRRQQRAWVASLQSE